MLVDSELRSYVRPMTLRLRERDAVRDRQHPRHWIAEPGKGRSLCVRDDDHEVEPRADETHHRATVERPMQTSPCVLDRDMRDTGARCRPSSDHVRVDALRDDDVRLCRPDDGPGAKCAAQVIPGAHAGESRVDACVSQLGEEPAHVVQRDDGWIDAVLPKTRDERGEGSLRPSDREGRANKCRPHVRSSGRGLCRATGAPRPPRPAMMLRATTARPDEPGCVRDALQHIHERASEGDRGLGRNDHRRSRRERCHPTGVGGDDRCACRPRLREQDGRNLVTRRNDHYLCECHLPGESLWIHGAACLNPAEVRYGGVARPTDEAERRMGTARRTIGHAVSRMSHPLIRR